MRPEKRSLAFGGAAALLAALAFDRYRRRRQLSSLPVLAGKLAIVTGGSRGLGFLLARELAREGSRVILWARDEEELDRARRALATVGADVAVETCDIRDRSQVEAVVRDIERREGPIDLLVNNAGIISVGPIETMTVQDYEASLATMFWGMVYPTLAVLPSMLEREEGRIANVTSIGGRISVPHLSSYCAAKFAAQGFSEGLRAELRCKGIEVTTILPGLMRTGGHVNALFKGAHEDEYRWFSLSASLPLLSMDAEKAARRILLAVKRGDPEIVVGLPAKTASVTHGLFPGLTTEAAALVNALLLPDHAIADRRIPGRELDRRGSWLLRALTRLGRNSVDRFQEHKREALPAS
jgi:short-subunit dehydrogenase